MTSTWHGQKLTARRRMMVPRVVKTRPPQDLTRPPRTPKGNTRLPNPALSRRPAVPTGFPPWASAAATALRGPGTTFSRSPACRPASMPPAPSRAPDLLSSGEFRIRPAQRRRRPVPRWSRPRRIAWNSRRRRPFARSAVAEPPAHPLQRSGDLSPPGVEVVAAAVQDDRRDPGQFLGLHLSDERERGPVVGLADLAAGDEQ